MATGTVPRHGAARDGGRRERVIIGLVAVLAGILLLLLAPGQTAPATADSASPSAVAATPSPAGDPYAQADALLRAGYVSEAAKAALDAYQASLATDPSATFPPRFHNLPNQANPLDQAVQQNDPLRTLGAWLSVLWMLAGVVVAFVALAIRRKRLGTLLEIGAIDGDAAGDKGGPALGGLIRAELERLSADGDGPALGIASGIDSALTLPAAIATAAPAAGVIAALGGLLTAPRHELVGEVGPEAGLFGRTLTLTLRQSDGRASAVSIPTRDYCPPAVSPVGAAPSPLSRLLSGRAAGEKATAAAQPPAAEPLTLAALASAAWVAYQVVPEGRRTQLPTADWRSFALARAGAALDEVGEFDRAARLYRESLARDPANGIAQFNLGSWLVRSDETSAKEEGVRLLEAALATQEGRWGVDLSTSKVRRQAASGTSASAQLQAAVRGAVDTMFADAWMPGRLWYRARHALVVGEIGLGHDALAEEHAALLVRVALTELLHLRGDRRDPATIDREVFVRSALLAGLVVLIATLDRPGPLAIPPTTPDQVMAGATPAIHDLGDLDALLLDASHPKAPNLDALLAWVCPSPETPLPVRAHYNFACVWNRRRDWAKRNKPAFEGAIERHLGRGVPDRRHARLAESDGWLASFKKDHAAWWAANVSRLTR